MRTDELHQFVLYLVSKWRASIYAHARHPEDFANIQASYETLLAKSNPHIFLHVEFVFPEVAEEDLAAIIESSSAPMTPEEERNAERERLSARLDFLLFRGSMADLNAANELMQRLALFDADKSASADDLASEAKSFKSGESKLSAEFVGDVSDKLDVLEAISDASAISSSTSLQPIYESCKKAARELAAVSGNSQTRALLDRIRSLVRRVEGSDADCPRPSLSYGIPSL